MQQELWIKTARYLLKKVTDHMGPGMTPSYYLHESIWTGCRNLNAVEIDRIDFYSKTPDGYVKIAEEVVDLPAPWNRREGC